jgi:hypothetical protein
MYDQWPISSFKVKQVFKKAKIIRKTGNKHFFKKSSKKEKKKTLSNFAIERVT